MCPSTAVQLFFNQSYRPLLSQFFFISWNYIKCRRREFNKEKYSEMNWMAFDTNSILIQCANPVCFRKFSIKIWKKNSCKRRCTKNIWSMGLSAGEMALIYNWCDKQNLSDWKIVLKSDNLHYKTLGCWVDGTILSLTNRLMFQV